ncbi:MAG TPA: YfiR family protein [Dongiaceae bacterium]|nr:YfiR family protein [Dongiaceae bacterium]
MTFWPANIHRLPHRGDGSKNIDTPLVRRLSLTLILFMLFALLCGSVPSHAESSPREYQVKAAFLYSIIKFVDWPATEAANSSRPLCLAILGQDPFGDDLDAIKGKSVKGRTIVIKRYRMVEDVKDCEVLFISASERGRLTRILKQFQNSPILTVADQEGFCQAGGMINFITVTNKISFEINTAAAHRVQLHISSQLLKLAKIVVE